MFPYTEKQAGHNHFRPCSTGDVSNGKGKCSLHSRNATTLAKERSDAPNSFPICTVSIKTKLVFELETGKSVTVIPHCCCLGQQGGWTEHRSPPSGCGLLNKMLELQSSPEARHMCWGAPPVPGTIPPYEHRCAAAAWPAQGLRGTLHCCRSEGVLQIKAMACFANTTCSVIMVSGHPRWVSQNLSNENERQDSPSQQLPWVYVL